MDGLNARIGKQTPVKHEKNDNSVNPVLLRWCNWRNFIFSLFKRVK
jgi:hypothetical protein